MSGLRLYLFSCGTLRFDPAVFLPERPKGTKVEAPIPFYLLEHPKGRVLVDTGCHPTVVDDPLVAWGNLTRVFYPNVNEEDLAPQQLRRIGVDPETVETVVCTHLHMDHAGGNHLFEHARFLVHDREWSAVQDPSLEGKGYFRQDWDHPLRYLQIGDEYDLFGDGSAVIRALPGHSPGHMGIVLKLDRTGTVVLGIDTTPMKDNLYGRLPRNVYDPVKAQDSVNIIREFVQSGAKVIYGHDAAEWSNLPLAPLFLD